MLQVQVQAVKASATLSPLSCLTVLLYKDIVASFPGPCHFWFHATETGNEAIQTLNNRTAVHGKSWIIYFSIGIREGSNAITDQND